MLILPLQIFVAGEKIGIATPLKDGLVSSELATSAFANAKSKTVMIEHTDNQEWRTISFYLTISREGSSDALFYICGVSSTESTSVKVKRVFSLGQTFVSFYYRRNEDKTVSIYCSVNNGSILGASKITKRPNFNEAGKSSAMIDASSLDLSTLTKIDII